MVDPTREELLETLTDFGWKNFDPMEAAEAFYWFAHDWHGGQHTNLYTVLCTSPFTPGRLQTWPEEGSDALVMLNDLQNKYFPIDMQANLERI